MIGRFHLPPVPPYLVFREAGASPATMGKFSVSGWLKMLTLEGAIEGNINTVDGGIGLFIHSSPFPLTEFLFLSAPFSFSPFRALLSSQKLQTTLFFPYLAKGRTTRIKLVLPQPLVFVPYWLWQVSETVMKWTINQNKNEKSTKGMYKVKHGFSPSSGLI